MELSNRSKTKKYLIEKCKIFKIISILKFINDSKCFEKPERKKKISKLTRTVV